MTAGAGSPPAAFPRISVAVMYHPAREGMLSRIAQACLPLRPVPVADPEPGGFPSPLRTAKRAWAALGADATHHLVLQDDVLLVDGFSAHLHEAVTARPHDALALYAHWNAPYNSYAIRQAAAAGASWARLVPGEWTPAQGLLLPAALAAELAAYLAPIPDRVRDDDTVIDRFLRERDRCVLAAVPHLLDHDEVASAAGNADHGVRRATVLLPGGEIPPGHWSAPPRFDKGAVMRAAGAPDWDFTVTFTFATCFLGFLRPVNDDCVRHPFGRWSDWCGVLGLAPADVLGPFAAFLAASGGHGPAGTLAEAGTSPAVAAELWAAAFLLGADVTRSGGARTGPLSAPLRRAAIASWVDSGLTPAERARLTPGAREALIDLGVEGVSRGLSAAGERAASSPLVAAGTPEAAEPPYEDGETAALLRPLAAREAGAMLRTACYPGPLTVDVVTCPVCGAGADEAAAYLETVRFCPLRVRRGGEDPAEGADRLRMAGCERLPVHGLTLVAHVRELLPEISGEFVTRSAFLLDKGFRLDRLDLLPALAAVDAQERWADDLFAGDLSASTAPAVMVLPVATGAHHRAARPDPAPGDHPAGRWIEEACRYGRGLDLHPLTPHAPAALPAGPGPMPGLGPDLGPATVAARYRALRDDLVRRGLTEATREHPPGPRVSGPFDPARFVRPW